MKGKKIIAGFSGWFVIGVALFIITLRLIGYSPYYIKSPSMAPAINVGDLVYVKQEKPEKIQEGDVITYRVSGGELVVTHRVIENDHEARTVITKGDSNRLADSNPVPYDNIVGTLVLKIPKLGFLSAFLDTRMGLIVTIVSVLIILAVNILG